MSAAEAPANEHARLESLGRTALVGTPREAAFDDLAELAATACGAPIAAVNLITRDRQWSKALFGVPAGLTLDVPREHSLCAHTLLHDGVFVVQDARDDARFATTPFVTGSHGLRFYAGTPLVMPDGSALGALCVMATEPRDLSPEQRRALAALGRLVVTQITLHEARESALREAAQVRASAVPPLTQTALEASASGMVMVNDEGAIVLVNSEIERIFGYPRAELLGRPVEVLLPRPARERHPELRATFRADSRRRAMGAGRDLCGLRRDGTEFPLEIGLTPLETPQGKMTLATVVDLTVRRASEAKILEQARALASTTALQTAILASANLAIVATELDGTIRSFNPWAERLLGYARHEVEGTVNYTVFHAPDELASHAATLSRELGREVAPDFDAISARAAAGQADSRTWTHTRKDGSRFPVAQAVTALRDGGGHVVGFLGVASDVSHLHAVERLKSEFVAVVSHELRTPLTSIRGSLRLLGSEVKGKLPPEARALVEIASANTERLIRLVNDILDIEKIEAGKLALKLEPLDVGRLVASALQGLRGLKDGAAATSDVPPGLTVRGDRDRLTQVIVNLVSNAAKFSPEGAPVQVSADPVGPSRLRVSVSDRGPGIDDAEVGKLFGKFQQLDSRDDRQRGGTGLGLAISKAIVTQHAGTIGVGRRAGGGSVFWFELPTAQAGAAEETS
ncbi:MAG: PAS domain S-box protein [Myxococcales bacterium]|nr:PAS domain S-box protein [Myxococcales bacterium]